jgi:hypothetical protein
MVNTHLTAKIRCRRIEDGDAGKVAELLARGFARRRSRPFWEEVMACLARRSKPADAPRYGYLLEHDGAAVGAILQICSAISGNGEQAARCNVSSWYVEPSFRGYASFLVAQALKQKGITYLNISSVPHTRPIVEAHGFVRFSNGIFAALPCLSRRPDVPTRLTGGTAAPRAPCEPHERDLLRDHAAYGCISLWCETPARAYPFVFRKRRVKGLVSCAQLIYCADIADVVCFARPLGLHLAGRGLPLVILDANGPIPGLFGKYFDETMPKYFKGATPPRLGDLAYTETALFGM